MFFLARVAARSQRLGAALVLIAVVSWPQPSAACPPERFIKAYESALTLATEGKHAAAFAAWKPLAEQGFAPAQSQLGRLYAAGKGTRRDDARALMWLQLAETAGEFRALKMARKVTKRLSPSDKTRAATLREGWSPDIDACLEDSLADTVARDLTADERRHIEGLNGVEWNIRREYKGITVVAEGEETFAGMKTVIDVIARFRPYQIPYFQSLDSVVVEQSKKPVRAERVDPHPGTRTKGVRLFVPATYVGGGKSPATAPAILIQAMGQIFRALDGVDATDRHAMIYKGTRLNGSKHPDVDNKRFFKEVSKALDLAAKLPPKLARFVRLLTGIRYDPPSKYSRRRINALAYYVHSSAPEKRRVVIIPRDLKYSGAAAILLTTLVHEGTHAEQDLLAYRKDREADRLKARLATLAPGSKEFKQLRKRIAGLRAYVALWREDGKAHVEKFECEAAVNELEAQKLLGIGRSVGATYGSICKDVEALSWGRSDNRLSPTFGKGGIPGLPKP
jgi:hypothetical protein